MRQASAPHDPTRWPLFDEKSSSEDDEGARDEVEGRRMSGSQAGTVPATATDFSFHVKEQKTPKSASPSPQRRSPGTAARDSDESEDDINFSYSGVQRRATKALSRQVESLQVRLFTARRLGAGLPGAQFSSTAYLEPPSPACVSNACRYRPRRSELRSSRQSSLPRRRATARRSAS